MQWNGVAAKDQSEVGINQFVMPCIMSLPKSADECGRFKRDIRIADRKEPLHGTGCGCEA